MMVGQPVAQDGDPPARLPPGRAIVVHGQGVAIVEIDSPQDRPMFREALGHKRGTDGLGVRAAQPPGGLESRRRFCGSFGGHGQEFTNCLGNIPCSGLSVEKVIHGFFPRIQPQETPPSP